MTISEAVKQVIKQAGKPLTPKECYERILEEGLYDFKAQNPLSVVISTMRGQTLGLDFPSADPLKHFRMEPNGTFSVLPEPKKTVGINRTTKRKRKRRRKPSGKVKSDGRELMKEFEVVRDGIDNYMQLLRGQLLKQLEGLKPLEFEHFSKRLLKAYGFENVEVTPKKGGGGDGGIDGTAKFKMGLAELQVKFACKRYTKGNVQGPEIDAFRGAIQGSCDHGYFFTTSGFSTGAKAKSFKAGAVPVILIDGEAIVNLMIEKRFGVGEAPQWLFTNELDTIITKLDA